MGDVLRRMLWLGLVASAVAYSTYLAIGSVVKANAQDTPLVVVRDQLTRGQHHLSGMVMVQSPCDQLSMHVDENGNALYTLTFTTWEEPSVKCEPAPTPRVFRATVFAPSVGVRFVATLDDKDLPLAVYPMVQK